VKLCADCDAKVANNSTVLEQWKMGAPDNTDNSTAALTQVRYKRKAVDGIGIFYREGGDPGKPTVVLLHGFPSSSHMFRDLIPRLAGRYHVIAPDFPGFGYSDQPTTIQFKYTFDSIADLMDKFLQAIGVARYSIYIQDYGAPVGMRLFFNHPERIQAIITQNGNAYVEGLGGFWADTMEPYWKDRNPVTEKKVRGLLTLESTKYQYSVGVKDPEALSPDSYTFDQMTLDRPGNAEIQLALVYDYQNNVARYPMWHETLRKVKPPVLAVWGKNDPFFIPAGAEGFKRDVPDAEIHFVDTGHFALEEQASAIADHIVRFLSLRIR
jgi:pimeloyl-ACP methyl ester carboxylesterase